MSKFNGLVEEVSRNVFALHGGEEKVSTEKVVETVLTSLEELGYVILPKNYSADISDIAYFESTIASWNANSTLEPSDVNGAQVLQSLAADGWVILPPNRV